MSEQTDIANLATGKAPEVDTTLQNPSIPQGEVMKEARKRIPMSVPVRKMEVEEIPGFHLYWFVESNVPRAIAAGYEFVKANEVPLHQRNPANPAENSGNNDLGTNISMLAGKDEGGRPIMQILMKIRLEWYQEDQKALQEINAKKLSGIFRGEEIMGGESASVSDQGLAYVDPDRTSLRSSGLKPLFQRPRKKAI